MFVLMLIQGSPIALNTPQDADMKERFFYWQGASGHKYIHSVYDLDACPPLPGAVYVGVKRSGHMRIAVAVGRFAPFWDKALGEYEASRLEELGVDEVHVHLLARNPDAAEAIKTDLTLALGETPQNYGSSEALTSSPSSPTSWARAA
jgi:hypothetical protein